MTDGRTDERTDGGDCNIPIAFFKKRGDKNTAINYKKNPDKLTYL